MATAATPTPISRFLQPTNSSRKGEPVWDIALTYPPQGAWLEENYLELPVDWPVEFISGVVEFLPMPTFLHQLIVDYLHERLKGFLHGTDLGIALQGPLRIRIGRHVIRLPDLVFFRPKRVPADPRQMPNGADLVMEVVSEGEKNRQRDYVTKRQEYARAGLAEYWIVDPQERRITVLALDGKKYHVYGGFATGQQATSALFPAFIVDVTAVFAAEVGQAPTGKGRIKPKRSQQKRKPG